MEASTPAPASPTRPATARRHRRGGSRLLSVALSVIASSGSSCSACGRRPPSGSGSFTRQENAVVKACVDVVSAHSCLQETEADDDALNSKNPRLGRKIAFLFLISFAGLLALVPLRKVMIVDYRLSYPSGLATAYLINGLHATEDNKIAKEQVGTLHKYFAFSFLWGFFQWFYSAGDGCGFQNFLTFGLEAYKNRSKHDYIFWFPFSNNTEETMVSNV